MTANALPKPPELNLRTDPNTSYEAVARVLAVLSLLQRRETQAMKRHTIPLQKVWKVHCRLEPAHKPMHYRSSPHAVIACRLQHPVSQSLDQCLAVVTACGRVLQWPHRSLLVLRHSCVQANSETNGPSLPTSSINWCRPAQRSAEPVSSNWTSPPRSAEHQVREQLVPSCYFTNRKLKD